MSISSLLPGAHDLEVNVCITLRGAPTGWPLNSAPAAQSSSRCHLSSVCRKLREIMSDTDDDFDMPDR